MAWLGRAAGSAIPGGNLSKPLTIARDSPRRGICGCSETWLASGPDPRRSTNGSGG